MIEKDDFCKETVTSAKSYSDSKMNKVISSGMSYFQRQKGKQDRPLCYYFVKGSVLNVFSLTHSRSKAHNAMGNYNESN